MHETSDDKKQVYLTVLEDDQERLGFLTDYVIFESEDIAYKVIVGIKEIENVLLYEPSSTLLCKVCN